MMYRDFCYWLRGFSESINEDHITEEQWHEIKKHLDICFNCEPKGLKEEALYRADYDCPPDLWNVLKYMPGGSC